MCFSSTQSLFSYARNKHTSSLPSSSSSSPAILDVVVTTMASPAPSTAAHTEQMADMSRTRAELEVAAPPASDREVEKTIISLLRFKATLDSLNPRVTRHFTATLLPEHFQPLCQHLDHDLQLSDALDKIRLSYDATTHLLTVSMGGPGVMHDATNRGIADLIKQELGLVRNLGGTTGRFASQIYDIGSALIEVETLLFRHPDTQFRYIPAKYPGVVLEISFSQAWKGVEERARKFIIGSRGQIAVILNIDFPDQSDTNKPNSNKATLSIWRAHFSHETGENGDFLGVQTQVNQEEFRSSTGHAINSDKTFSLYLHDFAPRHFCDGVEDVSLSFSYKQLAAVLDIAEKFEMSTKQHESSEQNTSNQLERSQPPPIGRPNAREVARMRQAKLDARDKDYEPEEDV